MVEGCGLLDSFGILGTVTLQAVLCGILPGAKVEFCLVEQANGTVPMAVAPQLTQVLAVQGASDLIIRQITIAHSTDGGRRAGLYTAETGRVCYVS
jgi:hypothetical protein